ncbi:MAG: heavy metal translocating P-type ATPase metal-binding domain-containing protein [Cyclobacteriaceae bacterium]|nr:heavy metal translocating P-type ATPase metal-binding domain-containing protein [Cyclobacteriaceae bacterium]
MEGLQENTVRGKDKKVICYHCGDICQNELIVFDEKNFCCNGCRTVYEILKDNDLCTYYDLEKNPGITLKSRDYGEKYNFLDQAEIQHKILDFREENTAKVHFYIPGIHCSSCIWLLENLYRLREGIRYSRVQFTKKELFIDFDPQKISLRQLVSQLATIGYEPFISLEQETRKKQKTVNRTLLIKIGIAGFSFGNIMLLSFPEYFGFEGIDDLVIQRFISWLNVLLALPVVFYCSTDYFRSAYTGLKQHYINIDVPISLGIITLFMVSVTYIAFGIGPGYLDSLAGLLFFLLTGRWIQNKTYEGLSFERDYRSYFPLAVNRMENGFFRTVAVKDLRENDVIHIRNQEIIPADSLLASGEAYIDYSFVTGESRPVLKKRYDLIYAGGRQMGQSIQLTVRKPVSQSYLTQLWNNEAFGKKDDSQLDSMINRISKYFTAAVLFIAFTGLIFWLGINMEKAWFVFTAVLIVACPCALSMSTPFTLGNSMNIFGRNHFYLKNAHVLEKMMKITHIVFDKTGTLTPIGDGKINFKGIPLEKDEKLWISRLISNSTHPLSRQILNSFGQLPSLVDVPVQAYTEVKGKGISGNVEGHKIMIGSSEYLMPEATNGVIPPENDFNHSQVHISINGRSRGYFSIVNHYRDGLGELIRKLGKRYKLSILSGDNETERKNLQSIFPAGTVMMFDQQPDQKLEFIESLQSGGDRVLMLGDGLNDAGALVKSDLGIAVTEDITSFTPASDGIMDASGIHQLDKFLEFSLTSRRIIIASFIISFLYNILGMGFAVLGKLTPIVAAILMPASSISVVIFATFAVNGMAKIKKLI